MLKIVFLLLFTSSAYAAITNESEVLLLQTGGNSVVETYNAKTIFSLKKDKRSYTFSGHYTLGVSEQTDANGDTEKIESARNWDALVRYEQELNAKLSGFTALQYEGDEFAGYKQRQNTDLGLKYILTKTDKINSFVEFGARYTMEKSTTRDEDGDDQLDYTKARFYYEFSNKVSKTLSYKFWTEYIPNFTDNEDYLLNFEPSLSYVLSDTFSLKTAYKGIYDNQPAVSDSGERDEYLDFIFTTSLIAKF